MNELFDTTEFIQEPKHGELFPAGYFKGRKRPTGLDEDIKALVVEDLLPEVLAWLHDEPDDEDEIRDQLLDVLEDHRDGYERAKRLEDDHCWDPDSELVDILDGVSFYRVLGQAVEAWIRDNDLKPKLAIQSQVNVCKYGLGKTTIPGVIVNIRPGEYVVACPSEGHDATRQCGFVLKWEDVEALNGEALEGGLP